jgi:phospholipase/lecithinase/hemolysin
MKHIKQWSISSLLILVFTVVLPVAAHDRDGYSQLVVFGDSLSDPGNLFALTGEVSHVPYQLIPSAPYDFGGMHFTNGQTWIEELAKDLHLSAGPAFRAHSHFTNYAVGGARARAVGFLDLTTQVSTYLRQRNTQGKDKKMVVLFIGGNDVRDAIESLAMDPTGQLSVGILTEAITSFNNNLIALISSGENEFLIANAPDLALVPAIRYLGPQAQAAAHFFSQQFNQALEASVNAMVTAFPITVHKMDVFSFLQQVAADPQSFDLTVVDTTCITPGVIIHAVCRKPDNYLFWDGVHPTHRGHEILAKYARQLLKQP